MGEKDEAKKYEDRVRDQGAVLLPRWIRTIFGEGNSRLPSFFASLLRGVTLSLCLCGLDLRLSRGIGRVAVSPRARERPYYTLHTKKTHKKEMTLHII